MTRRTFSLVSMLAIGGVLIVIGLLDLRETQLLRVEGVASRGTVTGAFVVSGIYAVFTLGRSGEG